MMEDGSRMKVRIKVLSQWQETRRFCGQCPAIDERWLVFSWGLVWCLLSGRAET
jgi:hypothetical protein